MLGNVVCDAGAQEGEEIIEEREVLNPATGDIEIFKMDMSGRWSNTGVKSRKPKAPPPRGAAGGDAQAMGRRTREEIDSGVCFRCGRDNHKARDCKAVRHNNGSALPPKRTPAKNIEQEEVEGEPEFVQAGSVALCALDAPWPHPDDDDHNELLGCMPCASDPWTTSPDPWLLSRTCGVWCGSGCTAEHEW